MSSFDHEEIRTVDNQKQDSDREKPGQHVSTEPIEPIEPSSTDVATGNSLISELQPVEESTTVIPKLNSRDSALEIWQSLESGLRDTFGDDAFENYIDTVTPEKDDGFTISFIVSNRFYCDYWNKYYRVRVEEMSGRKVRLSTSHRAGDLYAKRQKEREVDRGEYLEDQLGPNIQLNGQIKLDNGAS